MVSKSPEIFALCCQEVNTVRFIDHVTRKQNYRNLTNDMHKIIAQNNYSHKYSFYKWYADNRAIFIFVIKPKVQIIIFKRHDIAFQLLAYERRFLYSFGLHTHGFKRN